MFTSQAFKNIDREKIAKQVTKEGFHPLLIADPPCAYYPPHEHPETKLLVFLSGSMQVTVQDEDYDCRPGDKLIIPGNTRHSAVAGPDGCTFFWSERIF
jgi:quercetin dioxygenase-like cupin family protein